MGFERKKTPEIMDRIIQIVWHFQQLHNGATPSREVIANELLWTSDSGPGRVSWYIAKLITTDRLERIAGKMFRLTIRHHVKNTAAINRYKKLLAKIEAEEHAKAEAPSDVVVVDVEPNVLLDTAEKLQEAIAKSPATEPIFRFTVPKTWADAERIISAAGGDLEAIASHYILKTAKIGDLLEEVLDRGYTVHKTNPNWR